MEERDYKTLGTSKLYRLMSPASQIAKKSDYLQSQMPYFIKTLKSSQKYLQIRIKTILTSIVIIKVDNLLRGRYLK